MLNKSSLIRQLLLNRCPLIRESSAPVVIIDGQQRPQEAHNYQQKRYINKDYDKVVKLLPPRIEYKYKDSKFFNEHQLEDEPYVKLTDEEMCDLTKVKLEKDYPSAGQWEAIDINAEPFRQVLVGNSDDKGFTETETLADQSLWFWVERLLPKRELPKSELTDGEQVAKPSGLRMPPKTKPDLSYFIPRTRTKLLPVYRRYQIEDRNTEQYWKNRWDGLFNSYHKELIDKIHEIKWPNNEKTLVLTDITQIKGDIWLFEEDIRGELEAQYRRRILTSVHEPKAVLTLKGDFVMDCVKWLLNKGF